MKHYNGFQMWQYIHNHAKVSMRRLVSYQSLLWGEITTHIGHQQWAIQDEREMSQMTCYSTHSSTGILSNILHNYLLTNDSKIKHVKINLNDVTPCLPNNIISYITMDRKQKNHICQYKENQCQRRAPDYLCHLGAWENYIVIITWQLTLLELFPCTMCRIQNNMWWACGQMT